jgi:sugar-specific transcriptional regulator TrmB
MDKNNISIKDNEGAIIIREDGVPEIYAPIEPSDEGDHIRFTLAFLLYAVEKQDWIEEFSEFVDQLESKLGKTKAEMSAIERRSKFRIVEEDE